MSDKDTKTAPCISLLAFAVELLRVAKCPNCDGCGFTVHEIGGCDMDGENDTRECVQEQCQWCYERCGLIAEYDMANMELSNSTPERAGGEGR